MLNLACVFEHSAKEFSEKKAIIFGEESFTFSQAAAMVNKVGNALKEKNIQKGDKVALSCLNLPYFPIIYYGILKIGAVVVPLNVLLKGREIAYHLKDSEAKAYFCFEGTQELPMAQEGFKGFNEVVTCEHFFVITADPTAASPISNTLTLGKMIEKQSPFCDTEATDPNDTAVILYTSGTTGFPKGAELSHSNMTMNALIAAKDAWRQTPDDVHVIVLPLFHSYGQTLQMNSGFSSGNTLVLIPKFTPEAVLSAIEKNRATLFGGVPTMYWALLNHEDKAGGGIEKRVSTLRICISGASSLPLEIINGIEEKFNISIIEGYGLSETSPIVAMTHLSKKRKPGSIGTPLWGVEVDVFDAENNPLGPGEIGEVVVRGHNVMKGYYNKPDATAEVFDDSNWFHTGDLGKKDKDGYFYIVDRLKDMIIRGGYNVYPREIEEVLMTHPDVSLASVLGCKHDSHGEEIVAYIIPKEDASITADDIISWSKAQMANYKYPRIIHIRESLPMTATGKILKKELKVEQA